MNSIRQRVLLRITSLKSTHYDDFSAIRTAAAGKWKHGTWICTDRPAAEGVTAKSIIFLRARARSEAAVPLFSARVA